MTERQEPLPGLSKPEILESMSSEAIVDHIILLGSKVTELENDMNLAAEVLEGAYGLTVEQVLSQREIQNGEQK